MSDTTKKIDSTFPKSRNILLLMIIVMIPYAMFGMNFLKIDRTDLSYTIFCWIITFICLFLIPFYFIRYKWKLPLDQIGTHKGNIKLGKIIILLSLIAIPAMYIGSSDPNLQMMYPIAQDWFRTFDSNPQWWLFVIYEILYGVLYYIPYEFFWRGVVQLGLTKTWGPWKSIIFVTIITTLLHLTKPFSEIIGAAAVGIFFGYLAYKTDSWFYVFEVHYLVGILNDTFCGLRILSII